MVSFYINENFVIIRNNNQLDALQLEHPKKVLNAKTSKSRELLATVTVDWTIYIWDLDFYYIICRFDQQLENTKLIKFIDNDSFLVTNREIIKIASVERVLLFLLFLQAFQEFEKEIPEKDKAGEKSQGIEAKFSRQTKIKKEFLEYALKYGCLPNNKDDNIDNEGKPLENVKVDNRGKEEKQLDNKKVYNKGNEGKPLDYFLKLDNNSHNTLLTLMYVLKIDFKDFLYHSEAFDKFVTKYEKSDSNLKNCAKYVKSYKEESNHRDDEIKNTNYFGDDLDLEDFNEIVKKQLWNVSENRIYLNLKKMKSWLSMCKMTNFTTIF